MLLYTIRYIHTNKVKFLYNMEQIVFKESKNYLSGFSPGPRLGNIIKFPLVCPFSDKGEGEILQNHGHDYAKTINV